MKRDTVQSETFASLGYDPAHEVLEAEFRNGGLYQYLAVPVGLWQRFRRAPSKGGFFARFIRDESARWAAVIKAARIPQQ